MNKAVLEVLQLILCMIIVIALCCCLPLFLIYWDEEDDHRTHPRGTKPTGVNPYVLQSIPEIAFNSRVFKDAFVCVVCLSDFADGDKVKVLPNCNHCFHAVCIDTWLQSHSTCPICRNKVDGAQNHEADDSGEAHEGGRDLTSVLIDISVEPGRPFL